MGKPAGEGAIMILPRGNFSGKSTENNGLSGLQPNIPLVAIMDLMASELRT